MKSRIPSRLRTFVTTTAAKRQGSPGPSSVARQTGTASLPEASPVVEDDSPVDVEDELRFSDEEEDEEDDELQELENLSVNDYIPEEEHHQHLTYGDADSIIGGHSIGKSSTNRVDSDVEDAIDDEEDEELTDDLAFAGKVLDKEVDGRRPGNRRIKTTSMQAANRMRPRTFSNNKYINNLKQQKVFSFSLPFNNPLANIDLPSLASLDLPTVNFRSMIFNNNGDSGSSTDMQKDSLSEYAELDSDEEEIRFNSVKRQDNTRVRAVRNTLTRNFSLPLSPAKQDCFPTIMGDVVIMGGYRGSILRDRKTKRRIWIPLKAGLNMRKIDLTVGISDKDEYEMENEYLYPDGMLTHIGPIDISKKLIKKMSDQPGCNVHEFGYDWRLSSDINSQKLREFLRKVRAKNGGKPPIVIAHSMGGLVAHHALQKEPELFRGLLYAGVPSSCPNILGPLRYGDQVLLSSRILTAKVNFLMRSSFVFLPLNGRCFVDRNDSSKKYDLDFFDINTWIEYGLSPCVSKSAAIRASSCGDHMGEEEIMQQETQVTTQVSQTTTTSTFNFANSTTIIQDKFRQARTVAFPNSFIEKEKPIPYKEAKEYLERTLKRTKKFLLEVKEVRQDVQYPPLAVIYGCTLPTLRGAKVDGIEGIKEGDYDHLLFGAGDGVVYRKTIMPDYYGFPIVARIPSASSHVTLLTDIEGVGRALSAILEEESLRAIPSVSLGGKAPGMHHSVSMPVTTGSFN